VKPKPVNSIKLVPTIQRLNLVNGQLVATGFVTATLKGTTTTVPFTAPVTLGLAADQTGAADCPILDLELGPINLNLLGLVVETSPICLNITAHQGEGLLGDLLCAVANLLDGGLSLNQILTGNSLLDPLTGAVLLPGLTNAQLSSLNGGLVNLLNSSLQQLLGAVLTSITHLDARGTCAILHLELGPLDLNLLGLQVVLDDCDGGPVVVDITAQRGRGKLLGNLLCGLLDGGLLGNGLTLGQILDRILGQLA
jgi:hypothetical protein